MDLVRHPKNGKSWLIAARGAPPTYWSIVSPCPIDAQAVAAIFDGFLGNREKRLQNRAEYLPGLKLWRIGYRTAPGRAEQLAIERAYEAATRYFRALHGGPISVHLGKKRPKKSKKRANAKRSARRACPGAG